ncbi:hypothetical protein, partial [Bartonella sp. MM73XJBT]
KATNGQEPMHFAPLILAMSVHQWQPLTQSLSKTHSRSAKYLDAAKHIHPLRIISSRKSR